jgi:hypothetical protein
MVSSSTRPISTMAALTCSTAIGIRSTRPAQDPDFFAFYRSMQAYDAALRARPPRDLLLPRSCPAGRDWCYGSQTAFACAPVWLPLNAKTVWCDSCLPLTSKSQPVGSSASHGQLFIDGATLSDRWAGGPKRSLAPARSRLDAKRRTPHLAVG